MKTATDREVSRWIARNLFITLDLARPEDGDMWHKLAEEDTWAFLRLAEQGYRLRRKKKYLLNPLSEREFQAFLLEFRMKIQMLHDRVHNLPRVPFLDLGGNEFIFSQAFRQQELLYCCVGGSV